MSYSPPNYTDGVPIKISEKYKPPPPIHLPTKIIQNLAKAEVPVAFEDYNFDLEHKIISKTSEWINWRVKGKTERQERIAQRELARLKRLEEEQKQKLNEVSYPSTDEISSCDEDDDLVNEATNSNINQQPSIPKEKPFSPTNFNTILMPTQALQDPIIVKKSHRRYASNSSNKIDFSFFESDASPFDHLEMKSMNEMEVLAQILGSSVKDETKSLERDNSSESESSEHHKNNNNHVVTEPLDEVKALPLSQQQPQYQQNYVPQMYNNYYGMSGGNTYYNYTPATSQHFSNMNPQNQFLYPQNYAVNFNQHNYNALTNNNNTIVNGTSEKADLENKSKSVPSIIKELNDELNNSQRRKIRNNSQNSPKEIKQQEVKTSPSEDENEFSKLSQRIQSLITQITQMGFKKEMVMRALTRVGENDKKLVEHLIPLSELLQMGFEEERISEALIKFDNNKDRALDYLIS
ncbi:CLUMA_CG018067, isoform A [Clunio marinus]|uniref:CLUMA_CG018067, isoform A n=1 Tax=Clunio marinus TaxID=568069 RepID=A0A1J1IZA9_9DIPT|nr:CLUMA_CG018067, isoform A [Clunio marinus]